MREIAAVLWLRPNSLREVSLRRKAAGGLWLRPNSLREVSLRRKACPLRGQALSLNSRLRILPTGVLGSSVRNSTIFGRL